MKKTALISILFLMLSGSVLGNSDSQQVTDSKASAAQPLMSISMLKDAFKFGFQSGWLQSQDEG